MVLLFMPASLRSLIYFKIVRLCFDTPLSLRKALKLKAAYDDKEMKEALHELIQGYVDGKFKLK
jgi:hypothetical protein